MTMPEGLITHLQLTEEIRRLERERNELADALRNVENLLPTDGDPYDGTANGVIRSVVGAALDRQERA